MMIYNKYDSERKLSKVLGICLADNLSTVL